MDLQSQARRLAEIPYENLPQAIDFLKCMQMFMQSPSSVNVSNAIRSSQNLLSILTENIPFYHFCAWMLTKCLFVTWRETHAEEKRDRELLEMIASRIDSAVRLSPANDPQRSNYLATQFEFYCMVRNFSARLEDDFWNHERLNALNIGIQYAQAAWKTLKHVPSQAKDAARNLGYLLMSRYEYFGRPEDLEDALEMSSLWILLLNDSPPEQRAQAYVSHSFRQSAWSRYEDKLDESEEAIEYMQQANQDRQWHLENRDVTSTTGSGYAVSLQMASEVYWRSYIRSRSRWPNPVTQLRTAVSCASEAIEGMLPIDPGRLLCLNAMTRANVNLFMAQRSSKTLECSVASAQSALLTAECLLATRTGGSRTHSNIRISGTGNSIRSVTTSDTRETTPNVTLPSRRRYQRWIMNTLGVCADVFLARYEALGNTDDLEAAIVALRLTIQGLHTWNPTMALLLSKLNRALRQAIMVTHDEMPDRLHNLSMRSEFVQNMGRKATSMSWLRHSMLTKCLRTDFAPLRRSSELVIIDGLDPVGLTTARPVTARGSYDDDMQLSTDAPNLLLSTTVWCNRYADQLQLIVDHQIDHLVGKLPDGNSVTDEIRRTWNKIYCNDGMSLERAEIYQRLLLALFDNGDHEALLQFSDIAQVILGRMELHLLDPKQYASHLSMASNLAITIATIWLSNDRDLWSVLSSLERGRYLGSQHNLSVVRGYNYHPDDELLPQIVALRQQMERSEQRAKGERSKIDPFSLRSSQLFDRIDEFVKSEIALKPFCWDQCLSVAEDGYIIELVSSKIGSYAIIVSAQGTDKVHLSKCTYQQLCLRASSLRSMLETCEREPAQKGIGNRKLRKLLVWLWKAIVQPIVRFLRLEKESDPSSRLPRIKWVTCGAFSQLPIHAAGNYTEEAGDWVDQYAVSSYISSIQSSLATQQRKPFTRYYQNGSREFTLFGMTSSPKVPEGELSDLDVEEERQAIFASLGPSFTKNTIDNCNLGMAHNMMHWARIIHFTCHGLPHPTDPSQSRLVLLNDSHTPCTVSEIRNMDIPNALLLFLSACHSALDLQATSSDEITHVAKAFLLAGFPNVIGSLWQAYERSALDISAVFYAILAADWKEGQDEPEPDVIPRALHAAVCDYRDGANLWKPLDWAGWVCYTG